MLEIKKLLEKIALLNNKAKEIEQLTGEKFNIFNILGVQSKEVVLHSKLIAELLDHKGSHGLGNVFMELFISHIKTNLDKFDIKSYNVEIEKYIGKKTDKEGGRIDIYISSNKGDIIIENKIYAIDQENQLLRYHNYSPNAVLLYLSLDSHKPNIKGKFKYYCISYKDDIINWLEACKKETVNFPMLRETLTQYINTIKQLTGQTMNQKVEKEIINEITQNKESVESFFTLQNINDKVKTKLIEEFHEKIKKVLEEKKYCYELQKDFGISGNSELKIFIDKKENTFVSFYTTSAYFRRFIYGVRCESDRERYKKELNEALGKGMGWNWNWVNDFPSPYTDWGNNPDTWSSILEDKLVNLIIEKTEKFFSVFEDLGIKPIRC